MFIVKFAWILVKRSIFVRIIGGFKKNFWKEYLADFKT